MAPVVWAETPTPPPPTATPVPPRITLSHSQGSPSTTTITVTGYNFTTGTYGIYFDDTSMGNISSASGDWSYSFIVPAAA